METRSVDLHRDSALGYFLLRITIGTNICMHGISRILAGPASFAPTLVPLFQKTPLSAWSVLAFGLTLRGWRQSSACWSCLGYVRGWHSSAGLSCSLS